MSISRSTLQDLYEVGRNIHITNPKEPESPIVVYMRKLTPSQQELSVRKASAAKISFSKTLDRPDTDEDKIIIMNKVDELGGREEWVEFLTEIEIGTLRPKAEQELSEEEEWATDSRIQTAVDAWTPEHKKEFAEKEYDDLSVETRAIWDDLKEFSDQLEAKLDVQRQRLNRENDEKPDVVLKQQVAQAFLEQDAGMMWLRTFRNHQMLFGTLDPESKTQIFEDIEQVDDMPIEVYKELLNGLATLTSPLVEVK